MKKILPLVVMIIALVLFLKHQRKDAGTLHPGTVSKAIDAQESSRAGALHALGSLR